MLTRQQTAKVRSIIKNILVEVPFRLYIRDDLGLLPSGERAGGRAWTYWEGSGVTRASIWLRTDLMEVLFADDVVGEDLFSRKAFASYLIHHECGHVMQYAAYADIFREHFAPHGRHEQEQFANAFASASRAYPQWGSYHRPTREQAEVVAAYTDSRLNGQSLRRSSPVPYPDHWFERKTKIYGDESGGDCKECQAAVTLVAA